MNKAIGSRYIIEKSDKTQEYFEFTKDLLNNNIIQQMKNFKHHHNTTCYQHCLNVSYYSYLICRKLGLDSKSAARAGLLHDLYLYDWHNYQKKPGELPHGLRHPAIALKNAERYFKINKREKDIIIKHMWPLTIKLPKYAETCVIIFVDKYIALIELNSHKKIK